MPRSVLTTPEGLTLEREIAGAASRSAALLLDAVLIGAVYLVVLVVLALIAQVDPSGISKFVAGLLVGSVLLSFAIYAFAFETFQDGRTPGKRMLGLEVVPLAGGPLTVKQTVLRALLLLIDILPLLILPTGFLVAVLSGKRQRLGDLAAGTIVVRSTRAAEAAQPKLPAEDDERRNALALLRPRVSGRLSAADIELLRDLLTRSGMEPEQRRRLFVHVGRAYAQRLGIEGFSDARFFLADLFRLGREDLERARG